ncbi:MAG: transposase [Chlamydiae bacterium]|nr:transposase [Chlamydiota bacterium]
MARPLRIEYPDALYHITSRGNAKDNIYVDRTDREKFLRILSSVIFRYHWLCHAYCLMDNHYHLIIETPDANLSLGMRQLNGSYTQFFNWYHKRPGHIFQGRFKAILVEKDRYLMELSRYVVLNPIRAKMVQKPEAWEWSSYEATVGLKAPPQFLTTDWILHFFNKKKGAAQKMYRQFVKDGMNETSPWTGLKGQVLLGSDPFVERFKDLLKDKSQIKEIPRAQRHFARPPLKDLLPFDRMLHKAVRSQKICEAHVQHGYTLKEMANHLGVHYTTISKLVKTAISKN